jgi:biotin carboxyl carrier protein
MKKQSSGKPVNKTRRIIIIIAAILAVIVIGFFIAVQKKSGGNIESFINEVFVNPTEPDLKIKSLGIDLGYYDPATNKAGDVVFTKDNIKEYGNLIFLNYGELEKVNSAQKQEALNPQPTFIVPVGTKVRSLVDGEVVRVEKLYSGDYTVMVASRAESDWVYETEHVVNTVVKVGDKVKAGQVVAEASTYNTRHHPGFALYEIGILHGGNPPEHVCLFNYLDDSIKDDTFKKLKAFYKSWETYMGDDKLYDESKMVTPGCYTQDVISDNNQGTAKH